MAGLVNLIIGMMYSKERNLQFSRSQSHMTMVNRARLRIREALESNLTIQQVAEELCVSYSSFRKLFKEYLAYRLQSISRTCVCNGLKNC